MKVLILLLLKYTLFTLHRHVNKAASMNLMECHDAASVTQNDSIDGHHVNLLYTFRTDESLPKLKCNYDAISSLLYEFLTSTFTFNMT